MKMENIEQHIKELLTQSALYGKITNDGLELPTGYIFKDKFGIIYMNNVLQESTPTTNWERHLNKIFDFPTRKMRDAFKENFDKDLEFCKELL